MDALTLLLEDVDSLQLNIESNLSQLHKVVRIDENHEDDDAPSTPSAIGDSGVLSEIRDGTLETDRDFVDTSRTASVDFQRVVISSNEFDLEGKLM